MTGLSVRRAVLAEFTKLWPMRSIRIAVALFVLISIGVGVLEGWSVSGAIESNNPMLRSDFSAAQAGLDGVLYGQLAIIVLGVLLVTAEFGSGMLRLSLLAVPDRTAFFMAKVVFAVVVVTVVAAPTTLLAYLGTELALGSHGASISSPGAVRALFGAVAYLALMCLFSMGVAGIARNAIAPLAVLLPLVLAGSQILSVIGATASLARYLPDQAGMQLVSLQPDPQKLSPAMGLAVLVAWTGISLSVAAVLLNRRDA